MGRRQVARRGRWLQQATIAWNTAEFVVAVVAGAVSGSVALVGFGFDSALEVTSSVAALWRLGHDVDPEARERAERRASQVIGVCFLLLTVYVVGESVRSLLNRQAPDVSMTGIVLAALSLIVMPTLVHFKRRVARSRRRAVRRRSARTSRQFSWRGSGATRGSGGGGRCGRRARHGAVHRARGLDGAAGRDLLRLTARLFF